MILSRSGDTYYKRIKYNRWVSYYWQMQYISECRPDSILELGVGDGIMSSTLRALGYSILTCDISKDVAADVTADIRALPFKDASFDLIASFQVLEHLEYDHFLPCLQSLQKVARKHVLLSLPQGRKYFDFQMHLPWMRKDDYVGMFRDIQRYPPYEKPAGRNHYWEIGVRGYPLERIVADIERAGFRIRVNRTIPQNTYHRFFVLEKD